MGGLAANGNLIAPIDAVRFALAYLVLVMTPGYALAALARPRSHHLERYALAIPCAYSLVAVIGLATALLHLPFTLLSYAALALPVTLAGAWPATKVAWQTRKPATARGPRLRGGQTTPTAVGVSLPAKSRDSALGHWWLVPIGVAVAQVGAIALVYGHNTVPTGGDAISHVMWTNMIARSHIFPIALLSSHIGAADGAFYPPVFHALTALVLSVAPMATYRAVFFSVVAAVALMPVALFIYVRALMGSDRLGGLAALASLAFEPLPFFMLAEAFYPFTVSLLFVPALAMALRDGLGRGDRRARALAAFLGVGLFYTHPTELLTAGLLALAVVAGLLRDARSWVRVCGYGAAIAATWGLAAVPALAAVHRTMATGAQSEIRTFHDFTQSTYVPLQALLRGYLYWVYGINVSYLLLAAVMAGTVWCLVKRRYLGLVAIQLILIAFIVDSNSYNLLQRFYVLSFPWVLWERLVPTHYWFILPLAALGIDSAARFVRRLLRTKTSAFMAMATSPCILFGLLMPLGVATRQTAAYSAARDMVAPADLGAIAWLTRHAPAGSVVINDGDPSAQAVMFDVPIDAGAWLPAFGGLQPLFWRRGSGPGGLADRLYLLRHVGDAPLPARAARFASLYHVRYVFYGAAVRPGAHRHLNLARLLGEPELRLVYSSVAACQDDTTHGLTTCPATGSYVFALNAPVPSLLRQAIAPAQEADAIGGSE